MINHKFDLEKAFQQILHSSERWVNEGSGWVIEKIHSQYIKTFTGSVFFGVILDIKSIKNTSRNN